ncbi:winged helix-turn-helix transcriptional regulator [Hwanghaeella sp.]|uniref:winged helix-turn-helix transcriptional regulator n=1 Tax=Hwanghaeella sp. TaxID=2605943 RepID=UPI003CCC2754
MPGCDNSDMKVYRQYCPVAKATEILADRWTILIVRELVGGMTQFNDIARGLPGIPRSTLSNRLKRLEAHGIVSRLASGPNAYRYELTEAGAALRDVVHAIGKWGVNWAFDSPQDEYLDPGLLLWRMQHRLNPEALPDERTVIAFDFRMGRKGRFWFVITAGEASVCLTDPGFETGLHVSADLSTFWQVWLGRCSMRDAIASEKVKLEGLPAHERAFPTWLLLSPMAQYNTGRKDNEAS